MKVAYLGPEGSYSHLAAAKFCEGSQLLEFPSFRLVLVALDSGCDCAVLPIENSLNGGVNQNIDLLQSGENLIAFRSLALKIDHRLAAKKGADLSKITRIFSHPQALSQCGEFLYKNYPKAKLVGSPSTAASLDMLESDSDACIVGAHIRREGIELSKENIADEKDNFTNFLLVKKGSARDCARSGRVYFSATCRHIPGGLMGLLKIIAAGGFNMTKIESRPIKERAGEYRFFIEVEGDYFSPEFSAVLGEIEAYAKSVKILGVY